MLSYTAEFRQTLSRMPVGTANLAGGAAAMATATIGTSRG